MKLLPEKIEAKKKKDLRTLKRMIRQGGRCMGIFCEECPLFDTNCSVDIMVLINKAMKEIENDLGKISTQDRLQKHEESMFPISGTERGFPISVFTDRLGEKCSIQDSSLATEECIWLGVNNGTSRLCLTRKHAEDLIALLQKFIKSGSIEE